MTGSVTFPAIPEPGPARIRFAEEQLVTARRLRQSGEPERAVALLAAALRAGLWSHSRLWEELLAVPELGRPMIATLWLESPRRVHADLSVLRVVCRAAAHAGQHDQARDLLRKAILRYGYRRRRPRARLVRLSQSATRPVRRRTVTGRARAALTNLVELLGELGARPFLVGESLRQHVLELPPVDAEPRLEIGVLAAELAPDKLDRVLADPEPFDVRRRDPHGAPSTLRHTTGVLVELAVFHQAEDGRLWTPGLGVRWWHEGFSLSSAELLEVPLYVPDQPERVLAERYPDWRVVPDDFDPRLDSPNREVTDPALVDTVTYARLLEALLSEQTAAYRRYLRLLREAGESEWISRLRIRYDGAGSGQA